MSTGRTQNKTLDETVDVLVIGAGQAGLATGYALKHTGLSFVLLDKHARIGDPWRNRYDSLRLFSSRAYSALPGLPLLGDAAGYPGKDEVADYLETYAEAFDLPVITTTRVTRLSYDERFVATTAAGPYWRARAAIVATGAYERPFVPTFAEHLSHDLIQLTAGSYRRPTQLPLGRVLVVGDGATGRQVADELRRTHEVWLSVGRRRLVTPQRLLGKDGLWWSDKLGALRADRDSRYGVWVRAKDPIPGLHLRLGALRRAGVRVLPRTVGAEGRRLSFADGTSGAFDAVVWTLGYRDASAWLEVPGAVDKRGCYLHDRGVSPVPGLYFVGRRWQTNSASALLYGVGADAAGIVAHVQRRYAVR